jgi:hypothetical protein
MVLEVGIDGRGSRGSYSLGLIKSRDGSPVRAVEPSDCRITAYREEIAEEISGLVPFLPPLTKSIAQIESCARPRSQTVAVPRAACVSRNVEKADGRGANLRVGIPYPLLRQFLMTKFCFYPAGAQGPPS